MTYFPPLTHVALTVRDLAVSVPWYGALFDAEPVLDEDTDPDFHHTVYLLGNGTLFGLHQHQRAAPAERFSEFRVGLDHVAFGCADRDELEKWSRRLDELGIPTARSRMRRTDPGSASATPTASPSSSSRRPPEARRPLRFWSGFRATCGREIHEEPGGWASGRMVRGDEDAEGVAGRVGEHVQRLVGVTGPIEADRRPPAPAPGRAARRARRRPGR